MRINKIMAVAAISCLFGCNADHSEDLSLEAGAPSGGSESAVTAGLAAGEGDITAGELASLIKVLASDDFEGRAPGTPGETKTVAWLEQQFQRVGLRPGNGDSFTQAVPLVQTTVIPDSVVATVTDAQGGKASYQYRDDIVVWPKAVGESASLSASELVFVGYGIVAPEYNWNDYAGIDMAGKTAVILINDPGFATADDALFNGNAMTYYGRYTYKFEEARRQGAAGALIIHETAPAAYPWDVVRASWTGPQFDLVREPGSSERLPVEGWVQSYVGEELLSKAGLSLQDAHELALSEDFAPIPLSAAIDLALDTEALGIESQNVVGLIEGEQRPDEFVIYMAHWDHFGIGEAVAGDAIYNGALDNATSTAALIELAQKFTARDQKPARSILFLAVTAEEFGLYGSGYYAENPLYPSRQTVAAINMDGANIWGPVKDITIVGYGQNELQDYLIAAAAARDRRVDPEPEPEKGYFYRSDHFTLAKKGIPVLYTDTGVESVGDDPDAVVRGRDQYVAEHYHQPSDEYRDDWNLDGFVDDLNLMFDVGARLADGNEWPVWYEKSEFRAARERDMATKASP